METRKTLTIWIVGLALVACAASESEAAPMGTAFTYQGHLYDGNYPADGLYDFQFALYDSNDVCDCNQIGSDVNVPDIDVIDGYFTVELDFGGGPNAFNGDARWLEIGVRPGEMNDPNVYTYLYPRQEVTPSPYALYAASGPGVNDIPLPLELAADVCSPEAVLQVTNDGTGYAGYFEAKGDEARAVYGYASSNASGPTQPINYGGYFRAGTEHGIGVFGITTGTSGIGVRGRADNPAGSAAIGGYFSAAGEAGMGVFGYGEDHLATVNYGGYFWARGSNGRGVYSLASATSGTNYGVYGQTDSNDGYAGYFLGGKNYFEGNVGIGTTSPEEKLTVEGSIKSTMSTKWEGAVSGTNSYSNGGYYPMDAPTCGGRFQAASGAGVFGFATGETGMGLYGKSTGSSGYGVFAYASSDSGTNYGVYAESDSGDGYGGYFLGWQNYFEGNVGIGTDEPSAKLEVAGQVKITGGSPGAGKVLTSDVNGLASWQTASGIDSDWAIDGNDMYSMPTGNVGIGTPSPDTKLTVEATAHGIKSTTSLGTGMAVHGIATNTGNYNNYGGYFEAAGDRGNAVYASATGNRGFAVYAVADGNAGTGVGGAAPATGDVVNYGGRFTAAGDHGIGVAGYATSADDVENYGGYFEAAGEDGRAVYGKATGTDRAKNYGGFFEAYGDNGTGVYAYSDKGDAVYADANGTFGNAVYAKASGSSGAAIYALATGGGRAGYFQGDVDIDGDVDVDGAVEILAWHDQQLDPNGYAWVGSILFQWGTAQSTQDSSEAFAFPTAFPNACFTVTVNRQAGGAVAPFLAESFNTTNFYIDRDDDIAGSHSFNYMAIGH